ncbi:polyketide synthase [Nocardia sp. 2]|uniref:Polyketide synthase n=1 Tax=Nocardia acididurans TaxID=2802282 RepID=A0ABS1M998_9NOCA|nr:polyketide synthase [Nocardia acididurans]MBL1077222.1 polyketide synthase [Nocardia acididurans]
MTEDPIVIAGMAVEAPGGVTTLSRYWQALADAEDLIGPFPRDRGWPIAQVLRLSQDNDGWSTVRDAGGFLTGAADFDATFFGISPREAVAMDPQQRVGMRTAWRALENTGINPGELAGDEVGVYMGASWTDYGPSPSTVNEHNGYRATGMALGAVAGRISHALDVAGPSFTIDTACASSLSALHLAAAGIRNGDCEWAIAGAVCVMGSPGGFFEFSKANALSTDGQCKPYSADASGTLWGEGAGVVVVERESRALELGHRIYARVLATSVNHNGGRAPIAVPSAEAQERLVRKTVARAGIDAALVDMIEGHGTGTAVGDPLELQALQRVYGAAPDAAPLLGSVKSNLGHAQAAAGMLGLIKVLLSGMHGQIPPTRFADNPTTAVDWDSSGLRLAAKLERWDARAGVRYGAVSSFGVAGTNAHAIVAMPEQENHV